MRSARRVARPRVGRGRRTTGVGFGMSVTDEDTECGTEEEEALGIRYLCVVLVT